MNRLWNKPASPFLRTSHCEFQTTNRAIKADKPSFLHKIARYSRNHTFVFHRISNPKFTEIGGVNLLLQPYKVLHSSKKFFTGVSFFLFYFFFAHLARGLAWVFLTFHFVHLNCLSNNSLISAWISMKLIPHFYLCILYKHTKFKLHTNKCQRIRVHFTLHVERCHNLYTKKMNWMKLYTHKLHWYVSLWQ